VRRSPHIWKDFVSLRQPCPNQYSSLSSPSSATEVVVLQQQCDSAT